MGQNLNKCIPNVAKTIKIWLHMKFKFLKRSAKPDFNIGFMLLVYCTKLGVKYKLFLNCYICINKCNEIESIEKNNLYLNLKL